MMMSRIECEMSEKEEEEEGERRGIIFVSPTILTSNVNNLRQHEKSMDDIEI
jgi:hypothetical protein